MRSVIDYFAPFVAPYVLGCPEPSIVRAVVDAAIELCERSLVVQELAPPLDVVQGKVEYDLDAFTQQSVVTPTRVWFRNHPLQALATVHVDLVDSYRQDVPGVTGAVGEPRRYFSIAPNVIGLYPIPDGTVAGGVTMRVALRPTRAATSLADVLYDDWVEVIAAGALARLHCIADQPFASDSAYAKRQLEFRAGVNRAKTAAHRGQVGGDVAVRMRPFA